MNPRLKEKYDKNIVPEIMKELKYKSIMQVPKLKKITINIGVGTATQNPKDFEGAVIDLTKFAAQKPVITKAKKSIASFKIRQGNSIGCMVTLRGNRMYEFLDRLLMLRYRESGISGDFPVKVLMEWGIIQWVLESS